MRYYELKKNIEDIYYQLSKFEHDEIILNIIHEFQEGSNIESVINKFISEDLNLKKKGIVQTFVHNVQ